MGARATCDHPGGSSTDLRVERVAGARAPTANDGAKPALSRATVRLAIPTLWALVLSASTSALACAGEAGGAGGYDDAHDDGADEGPLGRTSSALSASDPVSSAVTQSCSTTAVKGLATQLVDEIQCLRPSTFARIDGKPGLALGAAVFPFLQTNAAAGLIAAQKARGVTMTINSGLRTLPQQYLLYRWYQTGRCGISLAAQPGTSNHESALALDIADNAAWRASLQAKGFRWLGANDPVHYDFVGGGTVDLRGLSVRAFQRLWNRNNPADTIAEDGEYGGETAERLAKSPVGGFAKGASCIQPAGGGSAPGTGDPGATTPSVVPVVPDATEPAGDAPSAPPPATETQSATIAVEPAGPEASDGCSLSPARAGRRGAAGASGASGGSGHGEAPAPRLAAAAIACALALVARRRSRSSGS